MTENYIEINSNTCKGCRVCVKACPKKCIAMGSEINKLGYQYAKFENTGCTACGMCYYACPELDTITVIKGK